MSAEKTSDAGKLIVAVPSKGRLQENANAFFARAGLEIVQGRGARDYRGALRGVDNVEIAFLSASDITAQLAAGAAHMGVTGEDLVRETIPDADARMELLTPLGFGHANVVVATPQAWIDVRTMADVADVAAAFRAKRGARIRVATKYVNMTRDFFAKHGVVDYRIVESAGATEGAPAAGQAEMIVDITTTGATLRANALKVLDDGVILKSEANLVASLKAPWGSGAREAARQLLARIAAEEEARTTREIRARIPDFGNGRIEQAEALFQAQLRGRILDGTLLLACPKNKAPDLAEWLISHGAEAVTVGALDYIFTAKNRLWEKLAHRLG